MKKRILALCFLLALVLTMLPLNLPAAHAEEDQDWETILALEALLIGIPREPSCSETQDWSDEEICSAIYCKLLWDDFSNSKDSYLHNMDLDYHTDNSNWYFDVEQIQALTMDTLGREFPLDIHYDYIYSTQDQVVIMPASGASTALSIQAITHHGNKIIAVGTAVDNALYSEFAGYFMAVLEENPDSIYGYTLCSMEKIPGNQYFGLMGASASSALQQISISCEAENVLDGDLSTAWVEGVSGVGIQQWIRLETVNGSRLELSDIQFTMGYHKTPELLEKNGWPYRIRIECEDGYQQEAVLNDYIDVVHLDKPVFTSWIKITILDAYEGSKFDDTCITEIQLLGLDSEPLFQEYIAENPEIEFVIIGDGSLIDGNIGGSDTQTIILSPEASQGGMLLNPTFGEQKVSSTADNLTTLVLVVVAAMAVAIVVAIIVLTLGKKKKR